MSVDPTDSAGDRSGCGPIAACVLALCIGVLALLGVQAVFGGWTGIPPGASTAQQVRDLPRGTSSIRLIRPENDALKEAAQLKRLTYVLVGQGEYYQKSHPKWKPVPEIDSEGFAAIATLPQLKQLVIANCRDWNAKCASEIAHSTTITQLSFSETELSADDLRELSSLGALRDLSIFDCEMGGDELEALSRFGQLRELAFPCAATAVQELPRLRRLIGLNKLHLYGVSRSEPAVTELRSHLPNCEITATAD